MSLTDAELAALDQLNSPDSPTLPESLADLGIDPRLHWEAVNAEREFAEYLLAAALQDLFIAGALTDGPEVVTIARIYWPIKKENAS